MYALAVEQERWLFELLYQTSCFKVAGTTLSSSDLATTEYLETPLGGSSRVCLDFTVVPRFLCTWSTAYTFLRIVW
jgi:hypothetical protein